MLTRRQARDRDGNGGGHTARQELASPPSRPEPGFRRHEYPPGSPRGFFTLFLDDDQGQHVSQVYASTPDSAASLMAPWAKGRLRRLHRPEEVPVELVGWDLPRSSAELSEKSGIPEDEIDPGCCFGSELCHVWSAEHEVDGETWTLYVIETVPMEYGLVDEPLV